MRPILALLAVFCSVTAHAAATAPPGWTRADPVSIGVHVGMWGADYVAPGIGGHIAWRPGRRWGIQGFWNSFATMHAGVLHHDHIIGFASYVPLIGGHRAFLAPTAGLCVDFRFAPAAQDIRFGVHAGLMGQIYVSRDLTLELDATAYGYWGNGSKQAPWSVAPSSTLTFSPVGQVVAAAAYHF